MECHSPCRQPYKQDCFMIRLLFLLLAFVAQPAYNSLTQKTADKLFFCGGFNVYPKKRDLLQTHAASQAWETLICVDALAMCGGQSVDAHEAKNMTVVGPLRACVQKKEWSHTCNNN